MLVTGFLTAKPGLLSADGWSAFRFLHTRVAPLLLVPLLYAHSLAGILFLTSRSKRLDRPGVRKGAVALWTGAALVVAYAYLAEPSVPSTPLEPPDADAEVRLEGEEAGGQPLEGGVVADGAATDGAAQTTGSARVDAASSVAAATSSPERDAGDSALLGAPTARPSTGAQDTTTAPRPPPTTSPAPPSRSIASASAWASAAPPKPDGTALVGQRCGRCHGLDKVYAKPRSGAEWQAVLGRMIALGAQLDADERRAVMQVLPRR